MEQKEERVEVNVPLKWKFDNQHPMKFTISFPGAAITVKLDADMKIGEEKLDNSQGEVEQKEVEIMKLSVVKVVKNKIAGDLGEMQKGEMDEKKVKEAPEKMMDQEMEDKGGRLEVEEVEEEAKDQEEGVDQVMVQAVSEAGEEVEKKLQAVKDEEAASDKEEWVCNTRHLWYVDNWRHPLVYIDDIDLDE